MVPALLGAVLLVGVAYFVLGHGDNGIAYRLAPVETGPIVSVVSATGTVELSESVPVAAQIAGEATEIPVDFNAEVKAGDILARIDPSAAKARLDVARSDLNVAGGAVEIANSQVELARRQLDNAKATLDSARASAKAAALSLGDANRDLSIKRELAATGDVSPRETELAMSARGRADTDLSAAKSRETAAAASYAATQAQLEVSQAQLSNARATLEAREIAVRQAEEDLDHTTVRAPVDGIVMAKNVVERQLVTSGQVLFTLARDLKDIELHARIDESDVGRIAPGQAATFSFGAYPGRTFQGQVTGIRKMPQVAEGIVTYVAVIVTTNDEHLLLPGMTAEIRIVVDRRDSVIKVPKAALRFTPPTVEAKSGEPGSEVVWRLHGDRPKAVHVRTGISDGAFTEIAEGDLRPGEQVIVGMAKSDKKQSSGPLRL
jgi:HlyD family secretion protein